MNTSDLKEYIKRAISLESTLYTQRETIARMDKNISILGKKKSFTVASEKKSEVDSISYTLIVFGIPILLIGIIGIICTGGSILSIIITIVGLILLGSGIMDIYRTKAENLQHHEEYVNQLHRIKAAMQDDEKRVETEKMMIPRIKEQRKLLYDKQCETRAVLDKLYDLDIIFPKYRNLISLCSFYEYLVSGRCTSLEGHEGAYNLFENEIRLNMIITKFNDVINRLDQIQDNQHMLHSAIQEGNRKIDTLVDATMKMSSKLDYIADQSAIAAQNTQWAAEELNTIKWIEISKL